MNDSDKAWIDSASYEQLLSRWRKAPVGDAIFIGDTGQYYSEAMNRKRSEVGHEVAVRASKNIGW